MDTTKCCYAVPFISDKKTVTQVQRSEAVSKYFLSTVGNISDMEPEDKESPQNPVPQ